MTKFISARFLVACVLLEMYEKGRKYARVAEIREIGDKLQDLFNKNEKDIIFLNTADEILDVVFSYTDIYKWMSIPDEGSRIYLNTLYDFDKLEKDTYIYGPEVDDLVKEHIEAFVDGVLKET